MINFKNIYLLLLCLVVFSAKAQLRLPHYYTDHMVLQRDKPVKISGWAAPAQLVQLAFNNQIYTAKANADSSWAVTLPLTHAGGPYTIIVTTVNELLTLNDVYFGDVWLCGGQSNMNFRMRQIMDRDKELADADYPLIRQFDVTRIGAEEPQKDVVSGKWITCSAATVDNFSAVAYQFAKNIYNQVKVPIGLINVSWGGSPIETFMSAASLNNFPAAYKKAQAVGPGFIKDTRVANAQKIQDWENNFVSAAEYISADHQLNTASSFFKDDNTWQAIQVPGFVEDQNIVAKKGISWYRKQFVVDAKGLSLPSAIDLGRINFAAFAYVNGQYLGLQPNPYYNAKFKLPAGILKEGKNVVLVCVYNDGEKTGFRELYKPVLLTGTEKTDLAGQWQYKQGKTFDKAGALGPAATMDFEHGYPTLAYNAIVHPFFNYMVKGCIWYQGEANATTASCQNYEGMLTSLINSWRASYNDKNLPFFITQISNYGPITTQPKATPWAIVQEAQTKVSRAIPNSGLAVTNDVGNALDVHPTNKQDVGYRLALHALKNVYGKTGLITNGPIFKSMKSQNGKLVLSFDNVQGGIKVKNGDNLLNAFAICGADKKFYRANARVEGDKVIVSSTKVANPVQVRYAFESSPVDVNFYNQANLPAVPFRTDDYQDYMP